jgi:hypothetical protein
MRQAHAANGARDIPERVAPDVAVGSGVWRGADSDAIEHDDDCAFTHRSAASS